MNYFSTGEISQKLNLSVRTIRYYDDIGLVKPTIKEDNGRRLYTPEDILMLQKVLLLKATSMPLKNIEKIINQVTIQNILVAHKENLELSIKQVQESLDHTNSLINTIKLEGEIQWVHLIPLLSENITLTRQRKNQTLENLFSKEEQKTLHEQLPKMETDSTNVARWINLIKRIELCIENEKKPSSKEGQLIAEDTLILSDETFQGNVELVNKFWEARKSEKTSTDLNLYPLQEEVMVFMEEAIDYYEKCRLTTTNMGQGH